MSSITFRAGQHPMRYRHNGRAGGRGPNVRVINSGTAPRGQEDPGFVDTPPPAVLARLSGLTSLSWAPRGSGTSVNRGSGRLAIWLAGALGALLLILLVMVQIAPSDPPPPPASSECFIRACNWYSHSPRFQKLKSFGSGQRTSNPKRNSA